MNPLTILSLIVGIYISGMFIMYITILTTESIKKFKKETEQQNNPKKYRIERESDDEHISDLVLSCIWPLLLIIGVILGIRFIIVETAKYISNKISTFIIVKFIKKEAKDIKKIMG